MHPKDEGSLTPLIITSCIAVFFHALNPATYIKPLKSRDDTEEMRSSQQVEAGAELSPIEEIAVAEGRDAAFEVVLRLAQSWQLDARYDEYSAMDEEQCQTIEGDDISDVLAPSRRAWRRQRRPEWVPREWGISWDCLVQFAAGVVACHVRSQHREIPWQMLESDLISRLSIDFGIFFGPRAQAHLETLLKAVPGRVRSDLDDPELARFTLDAKFVHLEEPAHVIPPSWRETSGENAVLESRLSRWKSVRLSLYLCVCVCVSYKHVLTDVITNIYSISLCNPTRFISARSAVLCSMVVLFLLLSVCCFRGWEFCRFHSTRITGFYVFGTAAFI